MNENLLNNFDNETIFSLQEQEYNEQITDIQSLINYYFFNGKHMESSYQVIKEAFDLGFVSDYLVNIFMKIRNKDNEVEMLTRYYQLLVYMSDFDFSLFETSASYLYDILTDNEKIFTIQGSLGEQTIYFSTLSHKILNSIDYAKNTTYSERLSEIITFVDKEKIDPSLHSDIKNDLIDVSQFLNIDYNKLKQPNSDFLENIGFFKIQLSEEPADFNSFIDEIKENEKNIENKSNLFKIFNTDDLQEFKNNPLAHKLVERNNYRALHSVDPLLRSLEKLRYEFPNMEEFIDAIEENALLNQLGNGAFYIPPSLLVGTPGIGKTFFLSTLLESANIKKTMIHMEALSGSWMLTGASPQWKEAKQGVIFNNIVDSDHANNAIILDEIDKINKGNYSPEHSLLQVFEEHTAKEFKDEFCPIKLDISQMIWLATANELHKISDPMLSRFNTYNIKMPTLAERKILAVNIYKNLLSSKTWGHAFSQNISDAVLDRICESDASIRTMKKDLISACGQAVKKGRRELYIEDFLKSTSASKMAVGF